MRHKTRIFAREVTQKNYMIFNALGFIRYLFLISLLPDSCGTIKKVLVHQTYTFKQGTQISNEILYDFLVQLKKLGGEIELSVLTTYRTEEENRFLTNEYDKWKTFVKKSYRAELLVKPKDAGELPYAQDIGVVLQSPEPSFIISKSPRITGIPSLKDKIEEVISQSGLIIIDKKSKYNLEGGYVYSSIEQCLYSNRQDKNILNSFAQDAIYVPNLIGDLLFGIMSIFNPSIAPRSIPTHVDLMFSAFETEEYLDVFFVDFSETLNQDPRFWGDPTETLLNLRLKEYSEKVEEVIGHIRDNACKEIRSHKVPGMIGQERIVYPQGTGVFTFVYSGANLLFDSINGKNYAFYLKMPSEYDETGLINTSIERALSDSNINAVPISRKDEADNLLEIKNSAGLRCIVKVLDRN